MNHRKQPVVQLTEEQRRLASDPQHIRMAERIAAKFARRYPPLADEFESECYLALCNTARTFKAADGMRFVNYARFRLACSMKDVCRRWSPRGTTTVDTLDVAVEMEFGGVTSGAALLPADDHPVGWEEEGLDELRGLCRRLPPKEGAVMLLLFGHAEAETMREIGRRTGMSKNQAQQRQADALAMLADRFGDREGVFMYGNGRRRPDGLVAPDWPALAAEIDAMKAAKKAS